MTITISELRDNISAFKYNPNSIARIAVSAVSRASSDEIDIVDVTNPFVALLSMTSAMTASWMQEDAILNRKNYKYSAQTVEDLLPHMSDQDHYERFAVPAYTSVIFAFDYDELVGKMVPVPGTGMKRVTIPRNTKVKIGELVFGIQYPIHITMLSSGSIQVLYDLSQTGPIRKIKNNVITSKVLRPTPNQKALTFAVEIDQFEVVSRMMHTNMSTPNVIEIDYNDQYCTARVWTKVNDKWQEITVSYTDEIYSHLNPTAVVQVLDSKVRVKIPQVYVNTGTITGTVRVDIYSTKGPLDISLSNYEPENYEIEWYNIDKAENDAFVAPLPTLRTVDIYSSDYVRGGQLQISFVDLYNRVIGNSVGIPDMPITPNQIESSYLRNGFNTFNYVDNITNRIYVATRTLPPPVNSALLTACAGTTETFNSSIESLSTLRSVRVNGNLTTLLPSTLYKREDGIVKAVREDELAAIEAMPPSKLPEEVVGGKYLFSPFHTVLDTTDSVFKVRTYWLNDPVVNSRTHVALNDTTNVDVTSAYAEIVSTATGFTLLIKTSSGDSFKELSSADIHVQLSYTGKDGNNCFMAGELIAVDDNLERTYKFDITTNYGVDADDYIQLTSFTTNGVPSVTMASLNQMFTLIWCTSHPTADGWTLSDFDSQIHGSLFPTGTYGVTCEQIDITFGDRLGALWQRSRTVVSEEFYERYEADILDYWAEDVFDRDPVTGSAMTVNSAGELVYNYKHRAGDVKLDAEGKPIVKYAKGSIKLDANGKSIVSEGRKLSRQFDIMLIDGVYYFANTKEAQDYVKELSKKLVVWINIDVPRMDKQLLENTEIFFQPTKTIGPVDVMYDNSVVDTIAAEHSFQVSLVVSPTILESKELRATTTAAVVTAIDNQLENATVSMSDIQKALREKLPDDVYNISVTGFGPNGDIRIASMTQRSQRMSIRKRLIYRSDGTLSPEEDVSVDFVGHDQNSVENYRSF